MFEISFVRRYSGIRSMSGQQRNRAIVVVVILSLVASLTGQQNDVIASPCTLLLANNMSYSAASQQFIDASQGHKVVVYFRLRVIDNQTGSISSFEAGDASTFEPDLWIWATSTGKNLLRVPLDYSVLSLGLLNINSARMNVDIDRVSADCLTAAPYDQVVSQVASLLADEITRNGSLATKDGPVVCRSAFAFSHNLFGMRGIGYRCCSPSLASTSTQRQYSCETNFTDSWQLVWYGPVALLLWVYLIAFVHFYKLYRHHFVQTKIRRLTGIHDTIEDIKQDIINRIVGLSQWVAHIVYVDDLISLRESCGFLDVIGVDRNKQSRISYFVKAILIFIVFAMYYVIYALFLYEYQLQVDQRTIQRLNDTQTVFLNVIGHFGWLLCQPHLSIFGYAVFEAVYTLLLPLFAGALYGSIALRNRLKTLDNAMTSKVPATVQRAQSVKESACLGRLLRFADSIPGRIIMAVCFLCVVVYMIFLAGPFIAYLCYFVGLGVFVNIEVISPWIIPLIICIHFFMTSFDPVTNLYKRIKDSFFTICLTKFKPIVIRRQKEYFIPRTLVETFYIPRSRPVVYSSVLRIMWILAFLILMVLVILTVQYPYYNQTSSIVSFLGVQVVFVLPLLAQLMNSGASISPLEQHILTTDIEEFIKNYIKQHPEIVQVQPREDGAGGNGDDGAASDDAVVIDSPSDGGGKNGGVTGVVAATGREFINKIFTNPYKI